MESTNLRVRGRNGVIYINAVGQQEFSHNEIHMQYITHRMPGSWTPQENQFKSSSLVEYLHFPVLITAVKNSIDQVRNGAYSVFSGKFDERTRSASSTFSHRVSIGFSLSKRCQPLVTWRAEKVSTCSTDERIYTYLNLSAGDVELCKTKGVENKRSKR